MLSWFSWVVLLDLYVNKGSRLQWNRHRSSVCGTVKNMFHIEAYAEFILTTVACVLL